MKPLVMAIALAGTCLMGCTTFREDRPASVPTPREIVDLGTLITEDTPEAFWGRALLTEMGFGDPNRFDVIHWEFGPVSGSNSYFRLFNHGGPHVDAPNHVGLGAGLDGWPVETFVGPLKVFDFSHLEIGRTITLDMVSRLDIDPGDIVIIYTGFTLPKQGTTWPPAIAPTYEAATYLANIPVRAFGTDALNVESLTDTKPIETDDEIARVIPGHQAFLSRGIPVFEQLVNVDRLIGVRHMTFVGVPLNIENADGMLVRPVVLVY